MQEEPVEVCRVTSNRELTEFIRFPWEVYRGNKHWVPPLMRKQKRLLSPSNPFFRHAEAEYYLARRGGKTCGRISVSIDHNYIAFHGEKMGCFGFFEVFNDFEVASRLLDTARDRLMEKGMEVMTGPINFTTREERGLLVDAFDIDAMMSSTYNPPYYVELVEKYGLKKAADYYSYHITDLEVDISFVRRLAEKAAENRAVARKLTPGYMRREMERIKLAFTEVYNNAWTENWGFAPLTEAEAQDILNDIRALVIEDLAYIGEVDGKEVGFLILLPDYGEVLRKMNGRMGLIQMLQFVWYKKRARKDRLQAFAVGVHRDYQGTGVTAAMAVKAYDSVIRLGYKSAEFLAAFEDNVASRAIIEMLGATRYKTHRVYQMPLSTR